MKRLPPVLLTLPLIALPRAGCERPVDPRTVRLHYEGNTVRPDGIFIWDASNWPPLAGDPGDKRSLDFRVVNGVRDEVFIEFGPTTAYVSSVALYQPGDPRPAILPVGDPPVADPAVSAGAYRHLLPAQPTSNANTLQFEPKPDSFFPVSLPLDLPAGAWDRAEVTVVFHLHGYTRETRGEFRDTLAKTFTVQRRTRPAQTPRPAGPAGAGLQFARPLTQPATQSATLPAPETRPTPPAGRP